MFDKMLVQTRESIQIGEAITYENLCIFPLLSEDTQPDYLSMKTALEKQQMEILEISEAGAVPNLKVINRSDLPVLIIDGEEVAGAKQNRIVNTSILVPAQATMLIPVSCTEQGTVALPEQDLCRFRRRNGGQGSVKYQCPGERQFEAEKRVRRWSRRSLARCGRAA